MPVTIRTTDMKYKDAQGNYVGINGVAERTTAEMVADVEAAGADTIADVQQVIADSQAALNGIDAQRNTMIAAIASVAGQGTDTTFTQSGVAADAAEVGKLKSTIDNTTICENLIGNEKNIAYPVYIKAGSTMTISTSDGSIFPSDGGLNITLLDRAKNALTSFQLVNGQSYRTFTPASNLGDIYYVRFNKTPPAPCMLVVGSSAETYVPYFGNAKRVHDDLQSYKQEIAAELNTNIGLTKIFTNSGDIVFNIDTANKRIEFPSDCFLKTKTGTAQISANTIVSYSDNTAGIQLCVYDTSSSSVKAINSGSYNLATQYIIFSYFRGISSFAHCSFGGSYSINGISKDDIATNDILYVSASGADTNNGTASHPLATVNKALENGARVIGIYGGTYAQSIDLSKTNHAHIELRCAEERNRVIFTSADRKIATSETAEAGYTKVYKATISKTFSADNIWLFQDLVDDISTLIDDAVRHPLERGYVYRCEDTKITKCTSGNLSDALAEIEASTAYKWYADGNTLYFSRPQSVSSDHAICYSSGAALFSNNSHKVSVKCVGIETKYVRFNIDNLSSAEMLECKAANVFGAGAFTHSRTQNTKYVRCEAVRAFSGIYGDGFNGHSTSSGDTFSKQTNMSLIDCYSHDNHDDGYSDHERCESLVIGGLYEWNVKGGIVPSFGCHTTCYNVYSRFNYSGFIYVGEATQDEGGKYGQMECYSCIAEGNTYGGRKAGFAVEATGNRLILIDCKAIGNNVGYYADSSSYIRMIDCTASGNTTVKSGNNITVNNTIIVE